MIALEHTLEREVLIHVRRAAVSRYLTDSERFAAWMGAGSHIDATPGGAMVIRYPTGVLASGRVVEMEPERRIVFTYGYDAADGPIPPGGSRVTMTFEEAADGTLVRLRHELAEAAVRDHHVQGWRYQLALLANLVASEVHARLAERIDGFFAAWGEADAEARRAALAAVATDNLAFRDRYSCTSGIDDLVAHLGGFQFHMPGVVPVREGEVRHCQGVAVVNWVAQGQDGTIRGRGTNVVELDPDGRIARVTGLWSS